MYLIAMSRDVNDNIDIMSITQTHVLPRFNSLKSVLPRIYATVVNFNIK